jgi:surface polysaccharide O-acyltransferase-like enzyme
MSDFQIANKPVRLFFVDNLRIALTILVVIHHQSLLIFSMPLFLMLNQAYFMGLFFFLSGCFTPASYDRKGMWIFLKGRLLRLGIPILVYIFVISPIAKIGSSIYQHEILGTEIAIPFTWGQYFEMTNIGPLWFLAMLLIFDICYLLWRIAIRNTQKKTMGEYSVGMKVRTILLFILALALVTYLVRIIIPINTYILFFPSLAYLPQYISFFILGTIAYRRDWLQSIPDKLGKVGFILAIVGTIILMPIAISPLLGSASGFIGGGTWRSAVYSLWDSLFSVWLCLGLLVFFRRNFNQQKSFGENLQKCCLTVYIIHSLIIIVAAYILLNLQVIPQLKLILASCISVLLCFLIAYLIKIVSYYCCVYFMNSCPKK